MINCLYVQVHEKKLADIFAGLFLEQFGGSLCVEEEFMHIFYILPIEIIQLLRDILIVIIT